MMTPKDAWLYAAQWGSFITSGDPGACMYGFDEKGLVQSEAHRRNCLDYIDRHCLPVAQANPDKAEGAEDIKKLGELKEYLANAPAADAEMSELDEFTSAYVTAALWTGVEFPEGHPMADQDRDTDRTVEHIAPDTLAKMVEDCAKFQADNGEIIAAADATEECRRGPDCNTALERAGHDFWMTRNGHGVGFWDGDWPEPYASQLDKASKRFGGYDLYTGDDGRVHGNG